MAAFAKPGVVLLHNVADKNDPNHKILADGKRTLTDSVDAQGIKFEVIDLPLADEVGQMNFYLCNNAVIVPILREEFQGRKIVTLSGRMLAKGDGGVHGITQQILR